MNRLVVLFLALLLTGCDDLRVFFAGPPPVVPFALDVLADASEDSSATPESVTSVVTRAADAAAERPGSLVRVWVLGPTVGRTRMVSSVVVPTVQRAGKRFRDAARDAFLREQLPTLLDPVRTALKEPSPRRTPLVQSVLLVAMADVPTHTERHLIVISDLRERELWPECSRPPNAARVNELLRASHCPTRLAGIKVHFSYCGLRPSKNPRCAMSVAAYEDLRTFWREWISANGGTTTFHQTEPLINE